MKTKERFENGLLIIQLEERFEMVAAGKRGSEDPDPDFGLTISWW